MTLTLELTAHDALNALDALEMVCGSEALISDSSARSTLEGLRVLRDAFRARAVEIRAGAARSDVEFEALF